MSKAQALASSSVNAVPASSPSGVPPNAVILPSPALGPDVDQGVAAGRASGSASVGVVEMLSRIPFHLVAMSFRKAVRIAIRPTATIASSSPYSAIAAPSSSRRKRRTPCIMRFMRELLGKDGWDLQRVRRQGVTPLSLGRSDERHRTAAVSGGEGDCKESTDPVGHPTTGAVRLQLQKQGLIERLFRTPARMRGPTRYGG